MPGLTLDAGALIAFDRNERRVVALIARAVQQGCSLAVPAGVVAQAWRDGRRQARLARLLGAGWVGCWLRSTRPTRPNVAFTTHLGHHHQDGS
jgi:hypothetical protein